MRRQTKWGLAAFAVSLVVAGAVSPYASPSPDGLETVALSAGFAGRFEEPPTLSAPMPDYSADEHLGPVFSTGIAGVAGTAICVLAIVLVGRWLSSGRPRSGASDGA